MSHVDDLTNRAHGTGRHPSAREPVTVPPHDPALALSLLRRRFPTVCLWFGTATRHWWAVVDGRLLEARTPQELGLRIDLAATDSPRPGKLGEASPIPQ